MSVTRWRLAEYLKQRGISAYALAKSTGTARPTTIYRLARPDHTPTRVDLPTLTMVIDGLRKLTGEDVQISDILEYVPDS
ncbi:helix-turn-helix domain-containing protein [Deinococcus koreensis]|uniref:HTH cro/C1-type domain-containing protein n=1 Tax=Deinococcus koreensis TaxID=2054903 RepID=A0A2K3UTQ0_9DEIO|nr:hypothetical protein CVO96_18435 [Deinococcus koreensis]